MGKPSQRIMLRLSPRPRAMDDRYGGRETWQAPARWHRNLNKTSCSGAGAQGPERQTLVIAAVLLAEAERIARLARS